MDVLDQYSPAPDRYERATFRRCGRSGLQLPAVSLGLWHNFGDDKPLATQREILRRAFDRGVTHFDLANNYGPPYGSAEKNFGRIFAEDFAPLRHEVVLSTKAGYDMWPGPYGILGSRKYLLSSLDESLARMRLDHVDIFYSHRFDPDTPLEETMGALHTAVQQGKARYAGISSYSAERTREAARILRDLGTPLLIHQPSYSMFNRWIEDELLDVLGDEGVGCIAFSPLAQGLLTDRYLDGVPEDSRVAQDKSLDRGMLSDDNLAHVRALNDIAGLPRPVAGPAGAGVGAAGRAGDHGPRRRQQRRSARRQPGRAGPAGLHRRRARGHRRARRGGRHQPLGGIQQHMTTGSVPLRARAWEWLRDPVVWVEVLQLAKTVLAAVLAWTIADQVLGLGQAFLAPWAALLVVHATVYRTVSRGAQQVAMTFLGVLLAFGAASVWGVSTASLAAVVALGLAAGLPRVVRAEGSTAAGTAVLVLLAGYSDEQGMLFDRLADTAVGVVVGLAVVVLVRPPLHDRALVRRIALIEASIGELLGDMAAGLSDHADQETAEVWMDATRQLDDDVDWAAAMLRQASESGRMNPRRSARPRLLRVASWADVVDRLGQAVSDARSMARTLQRQLEAPAGLGPGVPGPLARPAGGDQPCGGGRRRGPADRGTRRARPAGARLLRGRRLRPAASAARRTGPQPAQHHRRDGRRGGRSGSQPRPRHSVTTLASLPRTRSSP